MLPCRCPPRTWPPRARPPRPAGPRPREAPRARRIAQPSFPSTPSSSTSPSAYPRPFFLFVCGLSLLAGDGMNHPHSPHTAPTVLPRGASVVVENVRVAEDEISAAGEPAGGAKGAGQGVSGVLTRSEEHTSEIPSRQY